MKQIQYILLLASLVLLVAACQDNSSNEEEASTETFDLRKELQGTWQTVQINIALNTADGRDTFRTESLTEELWKQSFGMQPPLYYFQSDQKFRRLHKNLRDEVIDEAKGIWNVFGDTLMLIEPEATYQYLVRAGKGRATFRTFLDWDEDGEADDEYQGLHRKISISTN